jgi:type IV pilus assembly protein PilW
MGSLPMSLKGQLKKGKLQKAQLKRAQLKHSAARQSGLSMVELLVAMVIQFILLAAMIYVFSGSKQMFTVNEQMARVQENGRHATDALLYDIRMSGYAGCRSMEDITPNIIANSPPTFASLSDGLTVFEGGTGWTNPTSLTRVAGTDVITLQSIRGGGISLTGNMGTDNANIQITSNPDGLVANDFILISDCSSADLFRATSVSNGGTITIAHANSTNTTNRLSKAYQTDAQILSFDAHTYFVAVDTAGEPGLYQYSLNTNSAMLLTSGIDDMQLLLAEDTDGDQEPDVYVDATAVMDWEAVIGVRIGLLLQSANGIASESRSFSFNGAEANAGDDMRIRKAFWSYAALRNRIN